MQTTEDAMPQGAGKAGPGRTQRHDWAKRTLPRLASALAAFGATVVRCRKCGVYKNVVGGRFEEPSQSCSGRKPTSTERLRQIIGGR